MVVMKKSGEGNTEIYWQVKRDGVPLAGGPKSTMPDAAQRKSMRQGGCKIYVEGKLFKEDKSNC
jgi:hypothetical protein